MRNWGKFTAVRKKPSKPLSNKQLKALNYGRTFGHLLNANVQVSLAIRLINRSDIEACFKEGAQKLAYEIENRLEQLRRMNSYAMHYTSGLNIPKSEEEKETES